MQRIEVAIVAERHLGCESPAECYPYFMYEVLAESTHGAISQAMNQLAVQDIWLDGEVEITTRKLQQIGGQG